MLFILWAKAENELVAVPSFNDCEKQNKSSHNYLWMVADWTFHGRLGWQQLLAHYIFMSFNPHFQILVLLILVLNIQHLSVVFYLSKDKQSKSKCKTKTILDWLYLTFYHHKQADPGESQKTIVPAYLPPRETWTVFPPASRRTTALVTTCTTKLSNWSWESSAPLPTQTQIFIT